jgi:hypothetical protein
MKTNSSFLAYGALAALTVGLLLASSPTATAQLYDGQLKLADQSTQLETNVYPLASRPGVIKVIFNNRKKGAVQVVIRNEQGKVFYDAFEYVTLYRQDFNLSNLPTGNYSVELSTRDEHIVRSLAINTPPPATNYIAMGSPSKQEIPVPALPTKKNKRLLVNQ